MSLMSMAIAGIPAPDDVPGTNISVGERVLTAGFSILSVQAFLAGPIAASGSSRLVNEALRVVGPVGFVLAAMLAVLACVFAGIILARKNTLAGAAIALGVWFLLGYALGAAAPPGLLLPGAAVFDLAILVIVIALWRDVNIWVPAIGAAALAVWLAPAYVGTFGYTLLPSTIVRIICTTGITSANLVAILLLRVGRSSLRSSIFLALGVQASVATAFLDAALASLLRNRAR